MGKLRFVGWFVTAALLGGACAAEGELAPVAQQSASIVDPSDVNDTGAGLEGVAQGATVLEADPGFRTRMQYRKYNRVVYIETRREETPAEALLLDPTLPPYGTDLKITDRAGSIIYARIMNDGSDFAEGPELPHDTAAIAARGRDIALAREALAALESGAISGLSSESFGDEVSAARAAAGAFDSQNDPLNAPSPGPQEVETRELVASPHSIVAAASFKHRVELWTKACCAPGASHSATRVSNWNGSNWVYTTDFCNHGSCPNTGAMREPCQYTSGYRSGTARARMCSTGYGWNSTFSHNCNDDSHLEVIDVRHNRLHSTADGSCHDFGANPTPDGCDPNQW